jgi:hypothetical protein
LKEFDESACCVRAGEPSGDGRVSQCGHPLKEWRLRQTTKFAVAGELVESKDASRTKMSTRGSNEVSRGELMDQNIAAKHKIESFLRRKFINGAQKELNLLVPFLASPRFSFVNCSLGSINRDHCAQWTHHIGYKH